MHACRVNVTGETLTYRDANVILSLMACCHSAFASLLNDVKYPREVKGSYTLTLLHLTALYGWTDIVELLITKYKFDVNCRTLSNSSLVHVASVTGYLYNIVILHWK